MSESVQNIHIKGKEQSCKMCLVCENLVEMDKDNDNDKDKDKDNDKPPKPKVDTQKQQHPGKHRLPPLPSEKPKIRQLSHKEEIPPKILRNSPDVKINAQQPFEISQIDAKPFRELLERYEKEMALEGERTMREEMRAGKNQLSVESQMTNLRV